MPTGQILAIALLLLGGCGWFESEIRDIELDGDVVREIARYLQTGEAEISFEMSCEIAEGVASCEVVGSSSLLPGDLAARVVEDIGLDEFEGKVMVMCTVHTDDMAATECKIDLGSGYEDVPVDPPDEAEPPQETAPPAEGTPGGRERAGGERADGPDGKRSGRGEADRGKGGKAGKGKAPRR